jgi:hypothetical protein
MDQMTKSPVDSSTWERLLKSSRRLLAQRGPGATLSEIGRHAGIGCGMVLAPCGATCDEIREPMPFDGPNDQFELRHA